MNWTRRQALGAIGAAVPAWGLSVPRTVKTPMGIADFSYAVRRRLERRTNPDGGINDPLVFLEHARELGAGGIQTGLGVRDREYLSKLRGRADALGMYVEASIGFPKKKADVDRFDAQVRTAKEAGGRVIRSIHLGGRRYEVFKSLDQWKEFVRQSWTSLTLAEPVLARHRIKLGFENHKDWRIPEMLGLFKKLQSEWIGAWVDFSNSFSLLEDNMDVIKALAPHAVAAHIKDMAVAEYEDGLLLADVPLGTGVHDLPAMCRVLREANPKIVMVLEMSTRDALRVPCYRDPYWVTLKDVPGRDLAKCLSIVRAHATPHEKLPRVNSLPAEERAKLEEKNIAISIEYASKNLDL